MVLRNHHVVASPVSRNGIDPSGLVSTVNWMLGSTELFEELTHGMFSIPQRYHPHTLATDLRVWKMC